MISCRFFLNLVAFSRLPSPLPSKSLSCEGDHCVSRILIIKFFGSARFPALSLAEHVTVVFPRGKSEPEAGSHNGEITLSRLSMADTVYGTVTPDELVVSTLRGD